MTQKKIIKLVMVVATTVWMLHAIPVLAQRTQTFATSTTELDLLYSDAIKSYYQKDYSRAIALLKQIQGLSSEYKKSQIIHYIRSAESRLGKT
ncbi:MAG TPA: hypothetical protein PL060_06160, partial [bacterium]|nr:hypothetical protein [bacterium]